jgi:RecA-family ATPase
MQTKVDLLLDPYLLPIAPSQFIQTIYKQRFESKPGKVKKGSRNTSAFKLALALHKANLDDETIWLILKSHNKENVDPPLDESELQSVFKSSENYKPEKKSKDNYDDLQLITISEFLDESKFPKPEPIVHGLIHRGEFHLITAKAKVGKSWMALTIAHAVSEGIKCLEWFETVKSKVLIIQTEIGPSQIRERAMLIFGDSITKESDHVFFLNQRIKLDTQEGLDALDQLINEVKPDIVFLDPLYTLHNSNEDSSTEMAPLLSDIRDLAIKNNIAILMIHHQGKSREGGQQTGHKARGSSSFADAPDASWTMEKIEGSSGIRLSFETRNISSPGPYLCEQNLFNLRWTITKKIDETNNSPTLTYKEIVEHVKDHEGLMNKEILEDMVNNYGMSKRSTQKALAYAVSKEKLFKKKFGRNMRYFSNEMNAKTYVPKEDEDASINNDKKSEVGGENEK